jgi:threonylcarbamoyladenosine tRNA methylthiotransferase MtaB
VEVHLFFIVGKNMNAGPRVAFHTLGCKLNFAETSEIAKSLQNAGYAKVEMDQQPDVLVINTCSVTDHADQKCRNIVRRAIKHNPDVFVAVIGCYAQLKPQEIAQIEGVSVVLGANEKFNLLEHIQKKEEERQKIVVRHIKEVHAFVPSFSSGDRTRTFLKVQDGCNYFCAFCTIPLARGKSRSANIAETLIKAKQAVEAGAKEIVLTGVNIGDFGTAHGETFLSLIQQLDQLEGVERFRISSIEPNLLSEEIIAFVATSKKFMPHFHIPLQSGDDEILRAMRRRYRTDLYRERIMMIKQRMPHACIGVDVITGFPGETNELFLNTMSFLQSLPVSYLHVFTYSERANTTALRIEDVVPISIRQERTQQLRMLSEKMKRQFYQAFEHQSRSVLWESSTEDNKMSGYTDNYIRVTADWVESKLNTIEEITIQENGVYYDWN